MHCIVYFFVGSADYSVGYTGLIRHVYASTEEGRLININVLKDGVEENVRVNAKEQCSIPAGMGKYIPVQTNREIKGDVLVEISDKNIF